MFSSPDFFLNGVALHERLIPQDLEMTFHLCQLTLSAPLYKTLDTARHNRREVAKYPTVRSEIRVFSHAANQLEFNEGNLYQGRIPDRLVVGLLHTLSYYGDVAYPPFSFQKFGLSQIKQLVRGEVYPASALELNHNNTHKDLEGYFRFLVASEAWRKGQASMVEQEMWMWGGAGCCTLFMFDNVPADSTADSTLMNPRQDGDLRIRFKLGAAVNHVINVLLYAEFENVLEIDGNGGGHLQHLPIPKKRKKKNGMVGVIQRGIDPVGASGSDVAALFCGVVCQRPFTGLPASPGPASLRGQHRSARATGTALVGLVDAGRRHL